MSRVRSSRGGVARGGSETAEERHRPLYARALRLKHLTPNGFLCFAYLEGSIALGILLALAELVSWWGVLVLPATVAIMVKLNDAVAGAVSRTAVPAGRLMSSASTGWASSLPGLPGRADAPAADGVYGPFPGSRDIGSPADAATADPGRAASLSGLGGVWAGQGGADGVGGLPGAGGVTDRGSVAGSSEAADPSGLAGSGEAAGLRGPSAAGLYRSASSIGAGGPLGSDDPLGPGGHGIADAGGSHDSGSGAGSPDAPRSGSFSVPNSAARLYGPGGVSSPGAAGLPPMGSSDGRPGVDGTGGSSEPTDIAGGIDADGPGLRSSARSDDPVGLPGLGSVTSPGGSRTAEAGPQEAGGRAGSTVPAPTNAVNDVHPTAQWAESLDNHQQRSRQSAARRYE